MTDAASQRALSLAAGFGLLFMTVVYLTAESMVFSTLIVRGDAATTAANIAASDGLFRTGIAAVVVVALCDMLVAWALYILLLPVGKNLSLLAGWFRLVYAVLLMVALFNYMSVLQLLSGAEYLGGLDPLQLNAEMMLGIEAFDVQWAAALLIFGLHLTVLGYLLLKSDLVPKIIGVFVIAAGPSYVIDGFGGILFPDYDLNLAMLFGWGELLLMLWLLYRGIRPART